MTDPSPDDLARAWADTHWDDYATQPARGPLADAFRAGYAAALERAAGEIDKFRAWHQSEADRVGDCVGDRLHAQLRARAASDLLATVSKLAG